MIEQPFIFIAGHHRSGTSLLCAIIRDHPLVSGLSNTGVPEDEGQHLQTVFKPAQAYGGPGKYIFDKDSHMDENHVLANSQSAATIFHDWSHFYDPECHYYVEKSPPNLVKTRFLQKLFPNSKFLVIYRHPIAVAYATQKMLAKWRHATKRSVPSIRSLVEHSLRGYETFMQDAPHLRNLFVIRYEDFITTPQTTANRICAFLALDEIQVRRVIHSHINNTYFSKWWDDRSKFWNRIYFPVDKNLEQRANKIGYSMKSPANLLDPAILGVHSNQLNPLGPS